jgi:DnaJ-class molecular chaperone
MPRRREGDADAPGAAPGPLALVLKAAPHGCFSRRGSDLVHLVKLPLYSALAGGAVAVRTLDGR